MSQIKTRATEAYVLLAVAAACVLGSGYRVLSRAPQLQPAAMATHAELGGAELHAHLMLHH